jgi:hypothetical protein
MTARAAYGALKAFLYQVRPADGCILWPFTASNNGKGYAILQMNGKTRYAHRIICEKFNGPSPQKGFEVAHSCGNRSCVNPSHLRWASRSENHMDKRLHGTALLGQKNHNTDLTEADIRSIRADKRFHRVIAAEFGITRSAVGSIKAGKNWGWLSDSPQDAQGGPSGVPGYR